MDIKTILITGASKGIGASFSIFLASCKLGCFSISMVDCWRFRVGGKLFITDIG